MNDHPRQESEIERIARGVLRSEAETLDRLASSPPAGLVQAVQLILACRGRVIVSGMGKMSAVARKLAATLCSTGTPATFLHPAEALHGDLGMVTADELLIALSNSGETSEVVGLVPLVRRHRVPVIAITGAAHSSLARVADCSVVLGVTAEADPISDAPTNSTIAAMGICDAMAISLVHLRGFTREQFALFHPGGTLGRRLLLTVRDVMHSGDRLPLLAPGVSLRQAIVVISQKGLGTGLVTDEDQRLVGILTDGDLRRLLERHENPLAMTAGSVMTRNPQLIEGDRLAVDALNLMREQSITVLPVVESEKRVVGVVHLHDLLRAGLG